MQTSEDSLTNKVEQQFISETHHTQEISMSDQTTTLPSEGVVTESFDTQQQQLVLDGQEQSQQEVTEQIDTSTTKEGEQEYQTSTVFENSRGQEEAVIMRDRTALFRMMDDARICAGQKTSDQLQEEYAASQANIDKKDDIQSNKFQLPAELFKEFPEVNNDNGEDFEYYIGHIIIQFLENFPLEANKALEFPPCIDGDGRAKIHSICNFLGLASHSQGQAKTRKVLVYRKECFLKEQQKEEERKEKEKQKIRDKYLNRDDFMVMSMEKAISMRDKLIREVYYEKKGIKDPQAPEPYTGTIDERIAHLRVKMDRHASNLKKLKDKYDEDQAKKKEEEEKKAQDKHEKFEVAEEKDTTLKKPKVIKYKGKSDEEKKRDAESAASQEDELSDKEPTEEEAELLESMNEEEKKAYKEKQDRIKKQQQEEYLKREGFSKKLKETTLESFRDRPEEVKIIRCVHIEPNMAALEWDAPADNNSPITAYHVYLSSKRISTKQTLDQVSIPVTAETYEKIATTDKLYFDVMNLEPQTVYYFLITAENKHGEGYKAKQGFFVHTPQAETLHSLYTWGNNTSSELALSDEQLAKMPVTDYAKSGVRRVVRNESFDQGGIMMVAPGNATSVLIYVERQSRTQSLLQSGLTTIPIDEACTRTTFKVQEVHEKLQDIPSIPFQLDFNIPVVKVSAGDMFACLVTAEGTVHSWGYNLFGQLGIRDTSIAATLNPMLVHFPNSQDKIVDIACGFNHTLALTTQGQVYVWGRRQAPYPPFELSYHGLKAAQQNLLKELNADTPRLLKGNLAYYKVRKVIAGPTNSALLTTTNELLMQGMNDQGQLGVGPELGKQLFFFPEFMKKDQFSTTLGLKVVDAQYGLQCALVLCFDPKEQRNRLFGAGLTDFGQLGHHSNLPSYDFTELTQNFPSEIVQMSMGSFHSLFLCKDGKVYGCGKNSKGQLGFKGKKMITSPTVIEWPDKGVKVREVKCGSLFSMALVEQPGN